jgi:ABC-2 type transport system permease protein
MSGGQAPGPVPKEHVRAPEADASGDRVPRYVDRRTAALSRAAMSGGQAPGRVPEGRGDRGAVALTRLFFHELRAQQRVYWRNREAAFFTFLLPIVFLVLLGSVYGDGTIDGVDASTFLVAGMIGYGVAATAFAGLSISMVVRRESGVLKRIRGTPLPPGLYLAAVIGSTMVVIGLQVLIQMLIGRYGLDAGWPQSPLSFAVLVVLGATSFAALGLALTGLVRSAQGSSAVVNAIYLPMTFISGAFFSPNDLPDFLKAISDVLPLTYFLRLARSLYVEGDTLGSHGGWVIALALWGIVGLAAAVRFFAWEPREGVT